MIDAQLKQIARAYRTSRSRRAAAQIKLNRVAWLLAGSRRARRRAVRLMAEAFGVGVWVPPACCDGVTRWPVNRSAELQRWFPR